MPYDETASQDLILQRRTLSPLHNNCSGKHLGMLTTALHCQNPLPGYERPDHPVQLRVRQLFADLLESDLRAAPVAIDGCSVPTVGVTIRDIAVMMVALIADRAANDTRGAAARRIVDAMAEHPDVIAGSGRFGTDMGRATSGDIIVKGGAEGMCAALLRTQGLAIVLKAVDGARRAAEAAMATLIPLFAPVAGPTTEVLARYAAPPIENWRGIHTGAIRVVLTS